MLKDIPEIISPDLMKTIMEMGHGDELCLVDVNFPAASMARRLIRADGHNIPELMEAILRFYPLDVFVEQPVAIMDAPAGNEPGVWEKFEAVLKERDFAGAFHTFQKLERFDFYDRAKQCYAMVATSEHEAYSNIILKKGVIFK